MPPGMAAARTRTRDQSVSRSTDFEVGTFGETKQGAESETKRICCDLGFRAIYHWNFLITNLIPQNFFVIDVIALRHKFLRKYMM